MTLYHWDLPETLQQARGWINAGSVKWFKDYANFCFETFGDSVKYWITFNEPKQTCHDGYGDGGAPPLIRNAAAEYMCSHHVLLAHAEAYHLYDSTFREKQKGV